MKKLLSFWAIVLLVNLSATHGFAQDTRTMLNLRKTIPQCGPAPEMHESFIADGRLAVSVMLDDLHAINHYMHHDGRWVLVLINTSGTGCILQGGTRWATTTNTRG